MTALQTFGSACALSVAVVLVWAGFSKFRNRSATTTAFRELGLPRPAQAAVIVPAIELLIGVLAFARPRPASALATVLFVGFTAFLVVKLRSGATVSCGCFGSADPSPVSWVTICRNATLIGASLVATFAARSALSRFALTDALATIWIAAGLSLICALIIGLLTMKATLGVVFSQTPPTSP